MAEILRVVIPIAENRQNELGGSTGMKQHNLSLPERPLGDGLAASAISFGAMGMSEFYGTPPDDETSLTVLDRALELGVSMLDTVDIYGRGHNERLIGKFLARHPAERSKGQIRVATKFGIDRDPDDAYKRSINNAPGYIRGAREASLKRLGVERIYLHYAHRIDPGVPVAEAVGALAELKREGKIAHIGLCEVSAETLEKAHAVHPVAALQANIPCGRGKWKVPFCRHAAGSASALWRTALSAGVS